MSKAKADKMIDDINSMIVTQNAIVYDIGARLSAIKQLEFYTLWGFTYWTDFTRSGTVKMQHGSIQKYVKLYERSRELGYNREQVIQLVDEIGANVLGQVLDLAEHKVGVRKLRSMAEEIKDNVGTQLNLNLTRKDRSKVIKALKEKGGLVVENGRNKNLTEAVKAALNVS